VCVFVCVRERYIFRERERERVLGREMVGGVGLQGYLAHKKTPSPRTLGTSLIRKRLPLGPCSRPIPMALW